MRFPPTYKLFDQKLIYCNYFNTFYSTRWKSEVKSKENVHFIIIFNYLVINVNASTCSNI